MKKSIKLQLNLFFFILLFLFAVYDLTVYMVVKGALLSSVDRHITEDAKAFELSYFRGYELHPGYELYTIRTPNGISLETVDDTLLPFDKDWHLPDLRIVEVKGTFYRMLTYRRGDGFYIQYALNFTPEMDFLKSLKVFLFISWLFFLLILMGVYIITFSSILRSIKKASQSVFKENFDMNVYEELKPFMMRIHEGIKKLKESSEKHKNTLLALSHSVKTPLSTAILLLEDIIRSYEDKRLRIVRNELWRLEKSLTAFLGMAKMESQQIIIRKEKCHLQPILNNLIRLYDPEGSKIRLHIIQEPIFVYCDENILLEILGIIVDNSIRHGVKDGWVEVYVEKNKEHAYLTVGNLSEKCVEKEKLFRPFEGKHTGIGLYMVRELCRMMECELSIEQSKKGEVYMVNVSLKLPLILD